ncbi:hypothetical protein [Desulfopila sp. IMCC35008]|uniref:hypothetical protein n=1 Tax=Desulfopila sp. IMCC35008 TaxID=2653858 RepID=UPI0013D820DE|nr:hypothetical protein [Desulfopila sp. IMCC35008]
MTAPFSTTTQPLPLYKITPPMHLPNKLVPRLQLLEDLRHLHANRKKVIVIEAQAGSGKTVFAQQYIHQSGWPMGWCQIGPEDSDPIAFLHVLLSLLHQQLPGFCSNEIAVALEQGTIHYREIDRFAEILAQEIASVNCYGFHLVLDDLHLIEQAAGSISLLTTLIRKTPAWMQWILLSRHSVNHVLKIDKIDRPTLKISHDELDFSLEETVGLLNNVFQLTVPLEQVRHFHDQTKGWVSGIVLCAMHSRRKTKVEGKTNITVDFSGNRQHLTDYFLKDALTDFSMEERQNILQMVLLEELPFALLSRLFDQEQAKNIVSKMELNNLFFRCIDRDNSLYSFHHLFRESLISVAIEQLSEDQLQEVQSQAAQYYLEHQEPLRALYYALKNNDIALGERILQDFGIELLHRNRIETLRQTLDLFNEQTIVKLPWLSFYYGACMQDSEPVKAYPFLTNAQRIFSEQKNDLGILLVNSQLIEYHTIIDGHFKKMTGYVEELEKLYIEKSEVLPLPLQIRAAYSLALGFCFLQTDMDKVEYYDTFVLEMSIKNQLENLTGMSRVIRGYRFSFMGNWAGCRGEVEATLPLLNNPRVNFLTKLFLQMMHINLLAMEGDFTNYRYLKQKLFALSESDAISQSTFAPFVCIWDTDIALAEDREETAESILSEALQKGYAASGPHMRSQFLHYQAITFALQKKKEESLAAIRESLKLRDIAGGNAFLLLNKTILGKAYALLGMEDDAENLFEEVIQLSSQIGEEFQRVGAFAHRSWLRLQNGDKSEALKDSESCLQLMKKNGYRHFFSLMQDTFIPVLKLALSHNIERDFVTTLLYDQFNIGVTKKGNLVPLLELRMLSDWSISGRGTVQLSVHDLSEFERQLLYSIAEGQGTPVDRNVFAERLWPEKVEQKQRISLEVLLSNFRKKMAPLVSPHDPKEYLSIEQGRIRLRHCRIDVLEFLGHIDQAEDHYQNDRLWQAGNSFNLAFHLLGQMGLKALQWNGSLPAKIEIRYLYAAKTWSSLLEKQGRSDEARQLLENTFVQISLDCELARQLYNLHAKSQNPLAATAVADTYRKALQNGEYSESDREEMMTKFWN